MVHGWIQESLWKTWIPSWNVLPRGLLKNAKLLMLNFPRGWLTKSVLLNLIPPWRRLILAKSYSNNKINYGRQKLCELVKLNVHVCLCVYVRMCLGREWGLLHGGLDEKGGRDVHEFTHMHTYMCEKCVKIFLILFICLHLSSTIRGHKGSCNKFCGEIVKLAAWNFWGPFFILW